MKLTIVDNLLRRKLPFAITKMPHPLEAAAKRARDSCGDATASVEAVRMIATGLGVKPLPAPAALCEALAALLEALKHAPLDPPPSSHDSSAAADAATSPRCDPSKLLRHLVELVSFGESSSQASIMPDPAAAAAVRLASLRCIAEAIRSNASARPLLLDAMPGGAQFLLDLLSDARPAPFHQATCYIFMHQIGCCDAFASAALGTPEARLALTELIVGALATLLRSTQPSPFPFGAGRIDLTCVFMQLAFAAACTRERLGVGRDPMPDASRSPEATRALVAETRMGILLAEAILAPQPILGAGFHGISRVRAEAAKLLLFSPPEYAHYLTANGCLAPLLDDLRRCTTRLSIEGFSRCRDAAAAALPLLQALHRVSAASPLALARVRDAVFPADADAAFLGAGRREAGRAGERAAEAAEAAGASEVEAMAAGAAAANAAAAPRLGAEAVGTLRAGLLALMESDDARLKRCAGELVFLLSGKDAKEFVRRAGVGRGFYLLMIKGLVSTTE
jgi:hypothetical protein